MKNARTPLVPLLAVLVAALLFPLLLSAQEAEAVADRTLTFDTRDEGVKLPIRWGMDAQWISTENVRRGIAFIGKENLSALRVGYQPTSALVGDTALAQARISDLNRRINIARLMGKPELILGCDPQDGNVHTYFTQNGRANADRWAKAIIVTMKAFQKAGFTFTTVSPFNEPDYGWGQGTREDFRNICKVLTTDYADEMKGIRLSGGNTLNDDVASEWYNYLKPYITEGCTHQLAGDFNHYANFFKEVRANGDYATADELHNVMEAMVGVEYGMQTGIWWGFDSRARGEFCRASFGDRLAYAENRNAWSAAAVYRNTLDNRIEAFAGTSERQAKNSSYLFVCRDRSVYFDGIGPTHSFKLDMPGGNGYQSGQTNAERVIDITWGEDVPSAPIDGTYIVMNKCSRCVLSLENGSTASGTNIVQGTNKSALHQQWVVTPADTRVGGDFSFHSFLNAANGYAMDVWNWSLDNGGDVRSFNGSNGTNEQWFLQYAGDGWYYIRSRYSNLCLGVTGRVAPGNVQQSTFTEGDEKIMWRFLPVDAKCEVVAPKTPAGVQAEALPTAVKLSWDANDEEDLAGYIVVRGESNGSGELEWNTIARRLTATTFVDNDVAPSQEYVYKVQALDRSENRSAFSEGITATASGERAMVAQWQFDSTPQDDSGNERTALLSASGATFSKIQKKSGEKALYLNGSGYVQLPSGIAGSHDITVCLWMNWYGTNAGNRQRVFDFGSGTDEYMYFTVSNGSHPRFAIKARGGEEQGLDGGSPTMFSMKWHHVAITMGDDGVTLFVDGRQEAHSDDITLRPDDIHPVMNWIGRSQSPSDPLMKAYIDDVRIYNYALTADELQEVMAGTADGISPMEEADDAAVYDLFGRRVADEACTTPGIYIVGGKKIVVR